VRWYLSFKLSSRDLVQIMSERGIALAHTTILRWVQRYVPEFEKRWNRYARPVNGANVANLMLARMSVRSREIAVRLAIGASRRRLVRQLLTEALLLSLIGGAFGLMIGRWMVDATSGIQPKLDFEVVESAYTFGIDWRIVAFTILATFIAGIVSGVTPSIQGSRSDLSIALKGGSLDRDIDGRNTFETVSWSLRSLFVL